MPALNTISPKHLMRLLGTPDAPVIIDVRLDEDVALIPVLIPTAQKLNHTQSDTLLAAATDRQVVVVCHKGLKLSHGTAAVLRAHGHAAEVLEGGAVAWSESALPATPIDQLSSTTRWVTRQRPKVDRIACGWLIRRFIHPAAEILFVPHRQVIDVASRFDAIPFDVADVVLTHRGAHCTFDAIIADYGLSHPALDRLAKVVRAADTDQHATSPQAAGLLAVSVGLSRMWRDDVAQLDAAMPIYDALYRWARDGFSETHATDLGADA